MVSSYGFNELEVASSLPVYCRARTRLLDHGNAAAGNNSETRSSENAAATAGKNPDKTRAAAAGRKSDKTRSSEKAGWGFSILVEHQRRMSCGGGSKKEEEDGDVSRGSFVDLLRTSSLPLKSSEESSESSTNGTTSPSSSGFTEQTTVSCESTGSRTSISSSQGSSENVDGIVGDVESSPGRVPRRGGLSQRRIRSGKQQSGGMLTCSDEGSKIDKREAGKLDEERLFLAVQENDEAILRSLHDAGVSLESIDKSGRTPLIAACLQGNLVSMVGALLKLGANVHAFRHGIHAGYPLHHAAKRGNDKIVSMLLSAGAEPLGVNDDGQTALDMARIRGHASVVRVIEDWICLFRGVLRQITDNVGLQIMKRVWAVVLPTDTNPKGVSRHELVVYNSRKVPLPESVILLGNFTSEFEEPDLSLPDPSLVLTDRVTKTKFKFFAQEAGDKDQLLAFYKACKGVQQRRKQRS